jgi:hypothetical protein
MNGINYLQAIQTETERKMSELHTQDVISSGNYRAEHKTINHTFYFYGDSNKESQLRREIFRSRCKAAGLDLTGTDKIPVHRSKN